jgi:sugar lactone lactonase YvrE
MTWELIIDGIDFGEGPRWRDGRFWFSDFHQHTISSVGDDGVRRVEVDYPEDRPSGLGWLPDGRLLFVSMLDRRVMRREADGSIVEHADLSDVATGSCNDMVVDRAGNAYVGNFGFDLEGGAHLVTAQLALVRPDGTVESVADDLRFPNGSVITDDGSTLIVGETFGGRYTAFDIDADATLTNRRVWAEVPGTAPDGCTIDAEGAIWFSDAIGKQVVRVKEGGEVTHTISTGDNNYACMLGGPNGDRLYVLTCVDSHPSACAGTATGTLVAMTVDVPRNTTDLP